MARKKTEYQKIVEALPVLEQARFMWKMLCTEYLQVFGAFGTCVLGAGIGVFVEGKEVMLIPASAVCSAQGNLIWETSVEKVIAFVEQNSELKLHYVVGFMD